MLERSSKLVSFDEAVARIPDGATIAVGGLSYYGAPMELIRALVRRRPRSLTLVTAAVTGIQADMLIAAGCVQKIISPYVAFEEFGLAPNFRRAVESGCIELLEIGEAFLAFGLKAAASGVPFYVLPSTLAASDCARVNGLYKRAADPFTGREVICVPAIPVDFTLLHVRRADQFGNLQHEGTSFMDSLLARASRRVLASCDDLLDDGELRRNSGATTIPSILVQGIVHAHGAAWPTASFGCYDVDRSEIKRYAKANRNEASVNAFLDPVTLARSTALPPVAARDDQPAAPARDALPPSKAEIIATEISRCVEDGMFTGAGTGCWEVLAGLRLAQLTRTPNLSFTMGGSGALNPRLHFLPASLNGDEALNACEARVGLDDLFDLELAGAFDIMFASGMQIDQYGNLNLACIGPHEKPVLRGPGTVGLEFTPQVRQWVAFFRSHNQQVFVEKVDFISGIGYGAGPRSREQFGISDDRGPKCVITDLCVLDFCPETKRMRLKSVHPGATVERVRESTGFELVIRGDIPQTALPTQTELSLLRNEIDRGGLLTTLIA